MWNIVILVGGLFVLIAGVLMVLGGNSDGWRRIATGVMLVVVWFALRRGKQQGEGG